jgi:hypothetical protein
VKEHAKSVVLEATEAVTATLHLLDAQVQAVGEAVGRAGAVVLEDLGAPGGRRTAKGADLFDVVLGTPAMALSMSGAASSGSSVR